METTTFFAQHGHISSPGKFTSAYSGLPTSLPELVRIVQNITIHVFWAERYGLNIPPERMDELQLRSMERRLAKTLELDPRPLSELRSLEKKLVGNCRDHSILLASLLRSQGIPARARCGFGAYFIPGHFEDHWVAEYWNQTQFRWVLVDAQLDALQSDALKIGFNPLDVPRSQFIVAGRAWQMCRSGEQDADAFGIFDMKGLGFVRGNLVRDVAALNKYEMLPWDCWGVVLQNQLDHPNDLKVLDEIADLTAGDVPNFQAVRECYLAEARLRLNGSIESYVDGQMTTVQLDIS